MAWALTGHQKRKPILSVCSLAPSSDLLAHREGHTASIEVNLTFDEADSLEEESDLEIPMPETGSYRKQDAANHYLFERRTIQKPTENFVRDHNEKNQTFLWQMQRTNAKILSELYIPELDTEILSSSRDRKSVV